MRSQSCPVDCSPTPTTIRVGVARSTAMSGRNRIVERISCANQWCSSATTCAGRSPPNICSRAAGGIGIAACAMNFAQAPTTSPAR